MTETSVEAAAEMGKVLELAHPDFLRLVLARALRDVMEGEVGHRCGAGYGERSEERVNSRNGYRDRSFETRLGSVKLEVPKLREGSYFPSFLNPRRRWEQAFVNVVGEAYVLGVSTRKVEGLVASMGAKGMSKSEVSRMAAELDRQVDEFRQRRLERNYPYLWLDALYLKVREGGRVVSKAVLVAYGVAETGEREVVGCRVADGEMQDAWAAFLSDLLRRGLRGVQLVISDSHQGLRGAVRATLNGVSWQRCIVHFMRNVLSRVPKTAQAFAAAALRTVFSQPSESLAKEALGKAAELLDQKFPAAAAVLREGEEDVLTYMSFPERHWRQIRSTNPLERLNREIRRRTDVIGIFPNSAAALRLIVMLLVEQNDEWTVGRRYFSLESMAALQQKPPTALEAKREASAV